MHLLAHLTIGIGILTSQISLADSTPYLPTVTQPSTASGSVTATTASLSNQAITANWTNSSGNWKLASITNHYNSNVFNPPSTAELFTITLADNTTLTAADLTLVSGPSSVNLSANPSAARYSEQLTGKAINMEFQSTPHNLRVLWSAELRDGSHYVRPTITVSSLNAATITTSKITLLEITTGGQSGTNTYASTDIPKTIDTLGTPTINSTIDVPAGAGTITDINVTLDITHTWVNDLDITLKHSDGYSVELTTDNGASNADNYTNTTFDQQAGSSITTGTAPFTGTFQPEGNLDTTLTGKPATGTWTLEVHDDTSQDGGTLNSWSLDITTDSAGSGDTLTETFSQIGSVDGSPMISDNFFLAFEHPSAQHNTTSNSSEQQIGTWAISEAGSSSYGPADSDYDITALANNGTFNVTFNYSSGAHRLNTNSVKLLKNGVEESADVHSGYAGLPNSNNVYTVTLANYDNTASYSIRTNTDVTETGSDSNGNITLTSNSGIEFKTSVTGDVTLTPTDSASYTSVYGVIIPDQQRRSYLCYTERERAHSYRQFLHYNSWLDVSWNDGSGSVMTATNTLASMQGHIDNFIAPYNEPYNAFVFDDGWDDWNSLWEFNTSTFPNEFTPMETLAGAHGVKLGAWLSPFGGYDPAKSVRVSYGQSQSYETNGNGYSLSGPNYFAAFKNRCLQMVSDYSFSYFKFDGIGAGNGASGAGSEYFGDIEAMRRLTDELRQTQNDLFVNLTVGSWPSPYWLWSADSTWRAGSDMGFTGDGNNHERWITYRDNETYKNVVQRAPLYPLNSVMIHGIVWANYQHGNDPDFNSTSFKSDVHAYFGSGTNLQELYINPARLNAGDWKNLAECVKWSRENAQTLSDTHWIGGDPGTNAIYGWASWQPDKGVLTLRNPSSVSKNITITLADIFELPATAASTYYLKSPWIEDASDTATSQVANTSFILTLAPYEVLTLEATTAPPASWHANSVYREWTMQRTSNQRGPNVAFGASGANNTLAFALGFDAANLDANVLSAFSLQPAPSSPGGQNFQYSQAGNLGTTTLTAEISTDMITWNSGSGHITAVSDTANPDGTRQITIKAAPAYSSAPRIFYRLNASQ